MEAFLDEHVSHPHDRSNRHWSRSRPAASLAAATLSVDDIRAQIKARGVNATLRSVHGDELAWSNLLTRIATGNGEWLRIAAQLRPEADAGSSEQLDLAVGEALEHQPKNVLTIVAQKFGVDGVCSGPDVDDERFNSYSLSMAAIEKRKNSVRAVEDERLRTIRDACIATLKNAKSGIASVFGVRK